MLFFNKNYSIRKILGLDNIKDNFNREDILKFLQEAKEEVLLPSEGGHPVVDKEQLDVPIAVELETNTICNLRCKHCSQADYTRVMPLEKVSHILEILDENNVFEVNLIGGEFFCIRVFWRSSIWLVKNIILLRLLLLMEHS